MQYSAIHQKWGLEDPTDEGPDYKELVLENEKMIADYSVELDKLMPVLKYWDLEMGIVFALNL